MGDINMSYITVFTPTYNRAWILSKAYNSLLKQTFRDFIWVIMDDGSTDSTEGLVQKWINEKKIHIKYFTQKNMGRFGAYNNALKHFEGELVVFLDSDDCLMPTMLEEMAITWEERHKDFDPEPIGIISYMKDQNGKIYGNEFPNLYCERDYVLRDKYRLEGDKCEVYSRKLLQKYTYPIFEGERFIGDSLIMNRMAEVGGMIILNKALYVREYPEDSLTVNIAKVHYNSPKGMALYYGETIKYYQSYILRKLNCAMKYVTFSKIADQQIFRKGMNSPGLVALMYVPGLIYKQIIKRNAKGKNENENLF